MVLLCRNNATINAHVKTQNWVKHRVWHTHQWPDPIQQNCWPSDPVPSLTSHGMDLWNSWFLSHFHTVNCMSCHLAELSTIRLCRWSVADALQRSFSRAVEKSQFSVARPVGTYQGMVGHQSLTAQQQSTSTLTTTPWFGLNSHFPGQPGSASSLLVFPPPALEENVWKKVI